jgi:inosine/xanthosine triphosphate pyrophosphatase family protein
MKKYLFVTDSKQAFNEVQRILKKLDPEIILEQLNVFLNSTNIIDIEENAKEINEHAIQYLKDIYLYQQVSSKYTGIITEKVSLLYNDIPIDTKYVKVLSKTYLNDNVNLVCYFNVFNFNNNGNFHANDLINGTIVEPIGDYYEYDNVFIPKTHKKRFSEITVHEKDFFSHRSKALKKLVNFL